ncbi:hypothetical protein C8Q77DRAFT_1153878 [Trametes polyzona]|nr:hypothetical protein C8Q77DRAFT_1153878 [Trametes polyzona]
MPAVRSFFLLAATALLSSAAASPSALPHDTHDHDHSVRRALPNTWYHPEDHPVHALFRRADEKTDGATYAAIGSPEWSAGYPPDKVDTAALPKAWTDALNAALESGKIPKDVPVAKLIPNQNPVYPDGLDPLGEVVCSATYKCRNKGDLWDAPEGVFASSFDDGPTEVSPELYDFLKQNNVITTHFMIGKAILASPAGFKQAFEDLQSDIAVHTWTHPYMTTLTNEEVLGELGWTMQLIHNSTGGRIPKYWRPPYGDSDNRVRAIAKEVFGLTTVIWNQDTEDWSIGSPGGATRPEVDANLQKWITGPKSPGLVILEHELNNNTVGAFIQAFPLIQQNGWKFESLARIDGGSVYQNAEDSLADVTPASVGIAVEEPASSSPAGSPSGSASSSTPSGSGAPAGNNSGGKTSNGSSANGSGSSSAPTGKPTGAGAAQEPNGAASVLASGLLTAFSALLAAFVLS